MEVFKIQNLSFIAGIIKEFEHISDITAIFKKKTKEFFFSFPVEALVEVEHS